MPTPRSLPSHPRRVVVERFARFLRLTRVRHLQYVRIGGLALTLASLLSACSPAYVLRAAYEEGKILWRRQPIAEYIQQPDVNGETQEKLRTVLAVREYARDRLKLNVQRIIPIHYPADNRNVMVGELMRVAGR